MKIVVPFYPLYVSTEREDYFKICSDVTSGEIVPVSKMTKWQLIKKIFNQKVHGHGRGFPFPLLSCFLAKKSVYTFHNNFIGQKWHATLIRRFIFNHYNYITVHSEYAKKNYIKQGIKQEKIRILANPVDYEFFSNPKGCKEFRKRFKLEDDEVFALTIGTTYHKNPEIITEACRIAGIKLVMVGFTKVSETQEFPGVLPAKDIIPETGNIVPTGYLGANELLSAYDAATIYINSSDKDGENFGIAVYGAASAGVPMCLPDYGTFNVFNRCALFHSNHNPEQLAENIKKYINNIELRKRNAEMAKVIAANFDYTIVRKQHEQFYKEAGML